MTTITIKIDNEQNAVLLAKMLKALSFVDDVVLKTELENLVEESDNSYKKISKVIENIDSKIMFTEIEDPAKWQNDIRNEW
ncbi:hypothetical protein [Pedobacter mucosus]|uniref:hypothetical protein n=1 Tax=Pedobacter mucosus TaxID=2895286 RepID=UPI001EE3C0B4|nr:hypothetical protein [Pedobacter mucosus]UKT64588.1 hypothetical protein LOK61_02140 [Pedobacter mucosus]